MKDIIIKMGDENYPESLLHLDTPPEQLYCRGNIELLSKPAVAIVGMRDCTRYGKETAKGFAKKFAERGLVIVSGLADGIDASAHTGAILAKREDDKTLNTIAVLGNGLDHYYPTSNANLQKQIERDGLVISEYPNDMHGNKFTFPYRNRLIAALARAVIIVEADIKSGSLITKDFALELGRDVFAVPGPVGSYASRGTNNLIKTAACACMTDVQDVLEVFGMTITTGKENEIAQISFEARMVLDTIGADEVHFDEIIAATKFSSKKLVSLLTNMELDGLLKKLSGNYYASNLKNVRCKTGKKQGDKT